MVRRFVFFLFLAVLPATSCQLSMAQTAGIRNLYDVVSDTYETKADSMTNAFIRTFMVMTRGLFNDKYRHFADNAYWQQAHAIDVVIYNYQRHNGIDAQRARSYLNYIKLWYKNKANNYAGAAASTTTTPDTIKDYRMFENPYTDDMCWITLTLLHIGEATGTSAYSIVARQVFDNYIITRASEDTATGGLWLPWNNNAGSGPNACTQAPATLIAAKLYQKYGTEKYLEYAKKLYTFAAKKIVKSDGRVEEPPLTYTQGTFGEACRMLYHVTDESSNIKNKYKSQAFTYLNYAFTNGRCTNGNNILRHEGTSGDQSIFKAVLIPYAVNYVLDEQMPSSNRTTLCRLILKNTTTMWENLDLSHYPTVFCNYDWTQPYTGANTDAMMGASCSGASLVENSARMCRAIVDRYDLGILYAQCSRFTFVPGYEQDEGWTPFNTAMARAQEILANPGDYTTAQFREAITNLETAYQEVQDYATGFPGPVSPQGEEGIYDLGGRRLSKAPKGIYIKGGRKIMKNY